MRSSRLSRRSRRIVAGSCITATEAANTSRSIYERCRKQVLSPRLAVCDSYDNALGNDQWPLQGEVIHGGTVGTMEAVEFATSNGWTGSTIAAAGAYRQHPAAEAEERYYAMMTEAPWRRDLNKMAPAIRGGSSGYWREPDMTVALINFGC